MIKIFVSPFSKQMRWGDNIDNPKNFPHWEHLIKLMEIEGWEVTQFIGREGEPRYAKVCKSMGIPDLVKLVKEEMDFFLCGDNFLQHLCHFYDKRGFVIFGQSNPEIFGYPENINILKDTKYLRKLQFWDWEQTPYIPEAFPSAIEVFNIIKHYITKANEQATTYNSSNSGRSGILVDDKGLANEPT
jgi:hypothetical protein